MRIHSHKLKTLLRRTNMNANTYTFHYHHHILWLQRGCSLCPINRQPGVRRELAVLFAFDRRTINRDIHRFWGEDFFHRILVFFIETSESLT